MKRTARFRGHCVDSRITVVSRLATPFLAVDFDKTATFRRGGTKTRNVEIRNWKLEIGNEEMEMEMVVMHCLV